MFSRFVDCTDKISNETIVKLFGIATRHYQIQEEKKI
jgi:hypothetical protein